MRLGLYAEWDPEDSARHIHNPPEFRVTIAARSYVLVGCAPISRGLAVRLLRFDR
jgi:hypothetical protein